MLGVLAVRSQGDVKGTSAAVARTEAAAERVRATENALQTRRQELQAASAEAQALVAEAEAEERAVVDVIAAEEAERRGHCRCRR